MGPTQVDGLPAHVLLVHLVVALVPAAALLVTAQAWSRPVRRWAGPLGALAALAAAVLVPVTTHAGEWLQDRLPEQPAVERHADLGDGLLPWVLGLLALAVVGWLLDRRAPSSGTTRLQLGVAVLVTAVAAGAVVQTYRAGESGARAVWQGVGQP